MEQTRLMTEGGALGLSSGRAEFRRWGGEEKTFRVVGRAPVPVGWTDTRLLRLLRKGGSWDAGLTCVRPAPPPALWVLPPVCPLSSSIVLDYS